MESDASIARIMRVKRGDFMYLDYGSRVITGATALVFSSFLTAFGQPPQQMLQQRPIPMGVSIGNVAGAPVAYAGTAGMLVHSLANPNLKLILSNNHVLGARGVNLCPNSALP